MDYHLIQQLECKIYSLSSEITPYEKLRNVSCFWLSLFELAKANKLFLFLVPKA